MCGMNFLFAAAACKAAAGKGSVCVISDWWCIFIKWIVANQIGLLLMAICVAVAIPVSITVSVIIRKSIKAMLKRGRKEEDKISASLNKPILFAGIFSGFICGVKMLSLPLVVTLAVSRVYYVVMVCIVAWTLLRVLGVVKLLLQEIARKTENVYDDLLVSLVYPVLKVVVWVLAILFVAENVFNFKVTTLVTGAGIAAMAVAFAAQNTIANIFGALALISDRPFTIGDMISFNGKRGSVVAIGLRSTTLRTLDGTMWCVPNKEVAEASIENISKRTNIKWSFTVDLVYETTPDQIRRAKEIVMEILLACPLTDPEKNAPSVWFAEYAESSLRLTAVNWFQTTNWSEFCAQREIIQLQILEKLAEEKLELAFNTQTVHLING